MKKSTNQRVKPGRLTDMEVFAVSPVDKAANKRRFLIVKKENAMGEQANVADLANTLTETIGGLESMDSVEASEKLGTLAESFRAYAVTLEEMAAAAATAAEPEVEEQKEEKQPDESEGIGSMLLESIAKLTSTIESFGQALGQLPEQTALAVTKAAEEKKEKKPESKPEEPKEGESKKESAADVKKLAADLEAVLATLKKNERQFASFQKRFGGPNAIPAGEIGGASDEVGDEHWGFDMNAPAGDGSV